ncbi:MAG: hypothetical protein A2X36_07405 [Elusimicrobia bacterium GWA2_69_24]|nr:MAG: hypothetical protein A2X36_07405 [Elusimicrobia bacterium GWA2_69_24]HBL18995.1 hypothetical protein [Elusimicrobiota bacterium]
MDFIRVLVSLCELLLTVVMAVLVVYMTLRALIRANTDFDEDQEILRGNIAVGLLVASLLLAAANIMHQAFKPVADTIHLYLTSPAAQTTGHWKMAFYSLGNLLLAFGIVVVTLSFTLRLFGKLTRTKDTRPGKELQKGNLAVGIILSCVVLIVSLFVGGGVKSLSEALLPKPEIGMMRIMR